MKQLAKWMKSAFNDLVDPDREERIEQLVRVIQHGLKAHRQKFSLADSIQPIDYTEKDLRVAKDRVFRDILKRVWEDEKVTPGERKVTQWVARCLELAPKDAQELNLEFARNYFSVALANAMEDGVLDQQEEAHLTQIAASVGWTLQQFSQNYFRYEGERFLRGIFMASISDDHLSKAEWKSLLATTKKLGVQEEELCEIIAPQATQFVEHVLADAKDEGRLDEHAEQHLLWLVKTLRLGAEYRKYVGAEIAFLTLLHDIHQGKLPSLAAPSDVELRSGEIVHFQARSTWRETRVLKSETREIDHWGLLVMTDHRLMFVSDTKSQNFGYSRIVSHRGSLNAIEFQMAGKPITTFYFEQDIAVAYPIFKTALALANQTKTAPAGSERSRHIPREVRQRVWQKYGGRCADCGAKDYLEFDHVIPFSKGGSNSDANIQLLCRRCNLSKSDRI